MLLLFILIWIVGVALILFGLKEIAETERLSYPRPVNIMFGLMMVFCGALSLVVAFSNLSF